MGGYLQTPFVGAPVWDCEPRHDQPGMWLVQAWGRDPQTNRQFTALQLYLSRADLETLRATIDAALALPEPKIVPI